jgi:hypothetical protein
VRAAPIFLQSLGNHFLLLSQLGAHIQIFMNQTWTISAGGRLYGPYTAERMQDFVTEGRLAPHSLIARDGIDLHTPASTDPQIAPMFRHIGSGEKTTEVRPSQARAEKIAQIPETVRPRFGRNEPDTHVNNASRFIVMADMKSNSVSGLEDEIQSIGLACMLSPQTWLLTSELSISEVRNRLVQKLGKLDTIFVVDSTNNKAVWFNFGPEFDARIRHIWQKAQEHTVRRAV